MSAMTSFTLRSLSKNRARTLVTIAGVALAAALLTAVAASVTSLNEFLLNSEMRTDGTWTARTWIHDDAAIDAARADDAVEDTLVARDVGTHAFDEAEQRKFGRMLSVVSLEGDAENLTGLKASEGRLPQAPDEIILPKSFDGQRTLGADVVALGGDVTMNLGQRTARLIPGAAPQDDPYARPERTDVPDYQIYSGGIDQKTLADGDALNSCDVYRSADEEGAVFSETLDSVEPKTYTVVGFYEDPNLLTWSPNGYLAFTGGDKSAAGPARLYLQTSGFTRMADMEAHLKEVVGDTFFDYHSTLLRYEGVADDRAAWSSLYRFAAVLAAVIVIACVSLIHNAFAISIAERTRQFGLLSSIGASRRQIRGAVVFEALSIAAIGVPIGILVGLGGTAAVLGALAPSIERIAGAAEGSSFALSVEPVSLVAVAALTLAAVLASAWLPARRAGSVCAIEAIRGADARTKQARSSRRPRSASAKRNGLTPRHPFGVAGRIAHLNRKRGRGKGRAASISLGLAVVLLVTAGSATTYLSLGTHFIGNDDYDISVQLMSEGGLSASECADACRRMAEIDGVEGEGWSMRADLLAHVPDDMAGATIREAETDLMGLPVVFENDVWRSSLTLVFLEDEAFSNWARDEGIDPAPCLSGNAAGIGIKRTYGNDGTSYRLDETFSGTGTIEVLAHASFDGAAYEGIVYEGESAKAVFSREDGETIETEIEQVEGQMVEVRIEAVAEEGPIASPSSDYQPTVIMPASALGALGMEGAIKECTAVFTAKDHVAAAEQITEIGKEMTRAREGGAENLYVDVYDVAESYESTRTLIAIIELFSLLFTGILMLIAMGNVFNTVTNELILRKREFAVMRSIGMGARDFRKTIACECIGFGVRGLIPGVIISAGVSYLLCFALASSIDGLSFTLPWSHIALAIALTLAVTLASVSYGLRRCRTDSIAEALKTDLV